MSGSGSGGVKVKVNVTFVSFVFTPLHPLPFTSQAIANRALHFRRRQETKNELSLSEEEPSLLNCGGAFSECKPYALLL